MLVFDQLNSNTVLIKRSGIRVKDSTTIRKVDKYFNNVPVVQRLIWYVSCVIIPVDPLIEK